MAAASWLAELVGIERWSASATTTLTMDGKPIVLGKRSVATRTPVPPVFGARHMEPAENVRGGFGADIGT